MQLTTLLVVIKRDCTKSNHHESLSTVKEYGTCLGTALACTYSCMICITLSISLLSFTKLKRHLFYASLNFSTLQYLNGWNWHRYFIAVIFVIFTSFYSYVLLFYCLTWYAVSENVSSIYYFKLSQALKFK